MEGSSGYNVLLLGIVNNNNEGELIRVAAAVAFKNSVKRNWRIVSQLEVQLEDLKLFFFLMFGVFQKLKDSLSLNCYLSNIILSVTRLGTDVHDLTINALIGVRMSKKFKYCVILTVSEMNCHRFQVVIKHFVVAILGIKCEY